MKNKYSLSKRIIIGINIASVLAVTAAVVALNFTGEIDEPVKSEKAFSQEYDTDLIIAAEDLEIRNGFIYTVDQVAPFITKYDINGGFVAEWGPACTFGAGVYPPCVPGDGGIDNQGIGGGPTDIAVDKDGNVFATDPGGNRVHMYDELGTLILTFGSGATTGSPSTGGAGFFSPRGISISTDPITGHDVLYVADSLDGSVKVFEVENTNSIYAPRFGGGQVGSGGDYVVRYITDITAVDDPGTPGVDESILNPSLVETSRFIGGPVYIGEEGGETIGQFGSIFQNHLRINTFGAAGTELGEFDTIEDFSVDLSGGLIVADANNNRIQIMNQNGFFVREFGTLGSGDNELNYPSGVYNTGNKIYVADAGNFRIKVLDYEGTDRNLIGVDDVEERPTGITRSSAGDIYVVDTIPNDFGSNYVQRLDALINLVQSWARQCKIQTITGCMDGDGTLDSEPGSKFDVSTDALENVFVTDVGNHRVQMYANNGFHKLAFGSGRTSGAPGMGPGGMWGPEGIAVGPGGEIYLASTRNNRISKYRIISAHESCTALNPSYIDVGVASFKACATGDIEPTSGPPLDNPKGIDVSTTGLIYVADSGNDRFLVMDPAGDVLLDVGTSGTGPGEFDNPMDITVYEFGRKIFVADTGNNRIQMFDFAGGFDLEFGTAGTELLEFDEPMGVEFDDRTNRLYVTDKGNDRLYQFFFLFGAGIQPFDIDFPSLGSTVIIHNPYVNEANFSGEELVGPGGSNTFFFLPIAFDVIAGAAGYDHSMFIDNTGSIYTYGQNAAGQLGTGDNVDYDNDDVQKINIPKIKFPSLSHETMDGGQDQSVFVAANGEVYGTGSEIDQEWNGTYVTSNSAVRVDALNAVFDRNFPLTEAHDIASDEDGNLYITDEQNDIVYKYSTAGNLISQFSTGGPSAQGLAVTPDGSNILVSDPGNNTVVKYDSAGTPLMTLVTSGIGPMQCNGCKYLALDSNNDVWMTENFRIQKFDINGNHLLTIGGTSPGTGPSQFNGGFGVAVDADDNVYVADSFNSRIQKFDSGGSYLTEWATGAQPAGVAVDDNGFIYVNILGSSTIQKYDDAGTLLYEFGAFGGADGQLAGPHGIEVLNGYGSTEVFVGDRSNDRVQVYDTDNHFVAANAGNNHFLALRHDGVVFSWGSDNTFGQRGDGTTSTQLPAVQADVSLPAGQVVASGNSSAAVLVDGTIETWGANVYGQLGLGDTVDRLSPASVLGLTQDARQLDAGLSHMVAVMNDGSVMSWGRNNSGQLGDGTTNDRLSAVPVVLPGAAYKVAAGGESHSGAILEDGTVYMWGANDAGQLGDGTNTDRTTPVLVDHTSEPDLPPIADSDGDGVFDNEDECPDVFGDVFEGCPAKLKTNVRLFEKTGGWWGSVSKTPIEDQEVQVFSDSSCSEVDDITWATIFSKAARRAYIENVLNTCTPDHVGLTDENGNYFTGLDSGKAMVYAEYHPDEPGFDPVDLARVEIVQPNEHNRIKLGVLRFESRWGGIIRYVPLNFFFISGSELEVAVPSYIEWEEGQTVEDYPVINSSEDEWEVEIAIDPPEGFEPDEESETVYVDDSTETAVFELTEVGSIMNGVGLSFAVTEIEDGGSDTCDVDDIKAQLEAVKDQIKALKDEKKGLTKEGKKLINEEITGLKSLRKGASKEEKAKINEQIDELKKQKKDVGEEQIKALKDQIKELQKQKKQLKKGVKQCIKANKLIMKKTDLELTVGGNDLTDKELKKAEKQIKKSDKKLEKLLDKLEELPIDKGH